MWQSWAFFFFFLVNLKFASYHILLLYPGMEQACDANKKLTIYPNTPYFFLTSQNKVPLSEPCLAGSLGIDQSQSQTASLSAGRSAEDDTFPDSALSMTVLEWNPQPCLLAAKVMSIILFLTNSSHPSLNLIGLWSGCKTKTANLSVCVWTVLAIQCFWCLWAWCSAKFEKHDSHILGALMSHSLSGLKVHSIWGLVYFDVRSLVMRF